MTKLVTVVIPIYNGFEGLQDCLESVGRHSAAGARILLVDDASKDLRIAPCLQATLRKHPNFELMINPKNLGFVGSANRAIADVEGDVILLNSDTVVFPFWIEALSRSANGNDKVGVVCPLSDNATILSLFLNGMPDFGEPGDMAGMAAALASLREANLAYPIPTAVGFCMYIKRELLDRIGVFDPIFEAGYGEENDFCMRAWRAGYSVICQPGALVRHAGGASFQGLTELDSKKERNARVLAARWPQYASWIAAFAAVDPRWGFELWLIAAHARQMAKTCIVHCVHKWGDTGGVESYVRRLVSEAESGFVHMVVLPVAGIGSPQVSQCPATRAWLIRVPARPDAVRPTLTDHPLLADNGSVYQRFLDLVLQIVAPRVLHVHHMVDSFTLRHHEIAAVAGVPVVWGLHDYFAICPNYTLLKPTLQVCTKTEFDSTDSECVRCIGDNIAAPVRSQQELTQYDSRNRNLRLRAAAGRSALIFAPSRALAERLRPAWGDLVERIAIIPHHTYELEAIQHRSRPEGQGDDKVSRPVVVAHLGAFSRAKGADTFIALQRTIGADPGFEFWIIGPVAQEYVPAVRKSGIRQTGRYAASRLDELLDGVAVVCCLSNADETFGYTVDEALARGKRVIATRSRALVERHGTTRGLFLVDFGDYNEAARLVRAKGIDNGIAETATLIIRSNFAPVFEAYRGMPESQPKNQRDADAMPFDESQFVMNSSGVLERVIRPAREHAMRTQGPLAGEPEGGFGNVGFREWLVRHESCLRRGNESDAVDRLDCAITSLDFGPDLWKRVADATTDWVLVKSARDVVDSDRIARVLRTIEASRGNRPIAALVLSDVIAATNGECYHPRFKPSWSVERYQLGELADGCVVYRLAQLCEASIGHGLEATVGAFNARVLAALAAAKGNDAIVVSEQLLARRDEARVWARTGSEIPQPPPPIVSAPMSIDVIWFVEHDLEVGHVWHVLDQLLARPTFGFLHVVVAAGAGTGAMAHHASHPRLRFVLQRGTTGAALASILDTARAGVLTCSTLRPDQELLSLAERACRYLAGGAGGVTATIVDTRSTEVIEQGLCLGAGPFSIAMPMNERWTRGGVERTVAAGAVREVEAGSDRLFVMDASFVRGLKIDAIPYVSRPAFFVELSMRIHKAGRRILCMDAPWRPVFPPGADTHSAHQQAIRERERQQLIDNGLLTEARQVRLEPVACRYTAVPALARSQFFPAWIGCPKARPRVVALPYDSWGSGNYRVRQPLRALEESGLIDVEILPNHDSGFMPTIAQLAWAEVDVVFAHNPFHDYQIAALFDIRRNAKCRIVVGMDDLLDQLPDYNPYARTQYRDMMTRIGRVSAIADAWVFSTERLAQAYAVVAQHRHVIPNTLDPAIWDGMKPLALVRETGARPRVGWVGARQHAADIELLQLAYAGTRDRVQWVFMGMLPEFANPDEVEFHAMVRFDDYPAKLASLRLDIGLAPLVDNPFNRAKSSIKALEYLAVSALPICADIGVYTGLPVRLAPSTLEGFRDALLAALRETGVAASRTPAESRLPEALPAWLRAIRRP